MKIVVMEMAIPKILVDIIWGPIEALGEVYRI